MTSDDEKKLIDGGFSSARDLLAEPDARSQSRDSCCQALRSCVPFVMAIFEC